MTNTLAKLEAKGFVDARRDEGDGRGKRVFLTARGAGARKQSLGLLVPQLGDVSAAFSEDEFAAALPFLRKLRAFMDAARD